MQNLMGYVRTFGETQAICEQHLAPSPKLRALRAF